MRCKQLVIVYLPLAKLAKVDIITTMRVTKGKAETADWRPAGGRWREGGEWDAEQDGQMTWDLCNQE